MVDIHLSGAVPLDQVKQNLPATFSSLQTTAVDAKYRGVGVIEGYISLDDVPALAQAPGVRSVQLSLKPHTRRRAIPLDNRRLRAILREDVTVNGAINSSDIALVQSESGTALP
jgi:hypothetical protein